jgi:hypothetical protein
VFAYRVVFVVAEDTVSVRGTEGVVVFARLSRGCLEIVVFDVRE